MHQRKWKELARIFQSKVSDEQGANVLEVMAVAEVRAQAYRGIVVSARNTMKRKGDAAWRIGNKIRTT